MRRLPGLSPPTATTGHAMRVSGRCAMNSTNRACLFRRLGRPGPMGMRGLGVVRGNAIRAWSSKRLKTVAAPHSGPLPPEPPQETPANFPNWRKTLATVLSDDFISFVALCFQRIWAGLGLNRQAGGSLAEVFQALS